MCVTGSIMVGALTAVRPLPSSSCHFYFKPRNRRERIDVVGRIDEQYVYIYISLYSDVLIK